MIIKYITLLRVAVGFLGEQSSPKWWNCSFFDPSGKSFLAPVIRRVASYLTGACADFGLLENGAKITRAILPFKMEWKAAVALAYDLHFAGTGDNRIAADDAWALFGMTRADTIDELRRLSRKGFFIVQTAGDAIRLGWHYKKPEELAHAFAEI
jgi:hypothetical protein